MHTIAIEGQIHVEHVVVIDFRRTPEEREEVGATVTPAVFVAFSRTREERYGAGFAIEPLNSFGTPRQLDSRR